LNIRYSFTFELLPLFSPFHLDVVITKGQISTPSKSTRSYRPRLNPVRSYHARRYEGVVHDLSVRILVSRAKQRHTCATCPSSSVPHHRCQGRMGQGMVQGRQICSSYDKERACRRRVCDASTQYVGRRSYSAVPHLGIPRDRKPKSSTEPLCFGRSNRDLYRI
jgi:hypothetical protein